MFWQSHPYSWPVIGWPSDLRVLHPGPGPRSSTTPTTPPGNLTGVLVGNFDVGDAKALAEKYFRPASSRAPRPPTVVTLEMEQNAEKRLDASCDCQPQVAIRYHTVPFRHRDQYLRSTCSPAC